MYIVYMGTYVCLLEEFQNSYLYDLATGFVLRFCPAARGVQCFRLRLYGFHKFRSSQRLNVYTFQLFDSNEHVARRT